jgi:hypothetical protein
MMDKIVAYAHRVEGSFCEILIPNEELALLGLDSRDFYSVTVYHDTIGIKLIKHKI